jgi:hypothetical protein
LKEFDISSPDFNKDDPKFKPYRDRSKNIFYATLYGAGDAKIASTAGLPESKGKQVSESFWKANAATKQLKDNLEKYWETTGKKKFLPAIDGRKLITRKKSALLNTIFQSCGGIAMDYAGCFMDAWLGGILIGKDRKPYYLYKGYVVRRIGYFHDELEYECEEPIAEEVARMIEKSIEDSVEEELMAMMGKQKSPNLSKGMASDGTAMEKSKMDSLELDHGKPAGSPIAASALEADEKTRNDNDPASIHNRQAYAQKMKSDYFKAKAR